MWKVALFFFLFTLKAYGYPQFVGHGYNSCLTCHYNPHGAGALNDYGRALSATKISDRVFRSGELSEDQLAENSGFLYKKADTSWIRPALKYRGLWFQKSVGTPTSQNEFIHMLGRAQMTLKFGERDQFFVSGNVDYAPTPRGGQTEDEANYRSREHYVGYRPFASYGVYAGLMDKVFGVRVADHIAFSRTVNSLTMNDQSHGIVNHLLLGEWELGLHYFVGNLAQDEDLRQIGFSSVIERALGPRFKGGISYLSSASEYIELQSFALQSKIGFESSSSLVFELGQRLQRVVLLESEITSRYVFMQGHLYLKRGLYFLNTVEYLKRDADLENSVMRIGPGIQYFVTQGLEFRLDLYNSRIFSQENVSDDVWDLALQVHLWF